MVFIWGSKSHKGERYLHFFENWEISLNYLLRVDLVFRLEISSVSLDPQIIFMSVKLHCLLGINLLFRHECKWQSAGVHVHNFICVCTFHSQVTCITCNYKSNTVEPFWDLSLEFPERYHSIEKGIVPVNQTECMLTEMLAKFTETEALEGRIYACDQCNSKSDAAAVSAIRSTVCFSKWEVSDACFVCLKTCVVACMYRKTVFFLAAHAVLLPPVGSFCSFVHQFGSDRSFSLISAIQQHSLLRV